MPKICLIPPTKYRKVRLSMTALCVFGRCVVGVTSEAITTQSVKVHMAIPCSFMTVQCRHNSIWLKLFAKV